MRACEAHLRASRTVASTASVTDYRLGSAMTHFLLLVFFTSLLIIPSPSIAFDMTRPFVIVTHSLRLYYSSKPLVLIFSFELVPAQLRLFDP